MANEFRGLQPVIGSTHVTRVEQITRVNTIEGTDIRVNSRRKKNRVNSIGGTDNRGEL